MDFVVTRSNVYSTIGLFTFANDEDEIVLTQLSVSDLLIHCVASVGVSSYSETSLCNLFPDLRWKCSRN